MRLADVPDAFFDRLEEALHFRKVEGGVISECQGNLRMAQRIAEKLHLPWSELKPLLENSHGFCDCEVIFNTSRVWERELRRA